MTPFAPMWLYPWVLTIEQLGTKKEREREAKGIIIKMPDPLSSSPLTRAPLFPDISLSLGLHLPPPPLHKNHGLQAPFLENFRHFIMQNLPIRPPPQPGHDLA